MKVSIIIPFYNEEENVKDLILYLNKKIAKKENYEIVFVNDGSDDETEKLIKTNDSILFKYKIVSLSKNCGSHIAIRAGIQQASYDIVAIFSFDLQEPFEIIQRMENEIKNGKDIVFAYKKVQKRSAIGLFFSKQYSRLMKKYVNKDFPKEGINNFMCNKKVKDQINCNIESNSSIFLQVLSLGFNRTFIPYELNARNKGKSKWTLKKKIKLLLDSFISFSYFPIRLVSLMGIILFLIGIIYAIIILILKLCGNNMPLGFPTLIVIILLGFGCTNISLGIISEYLWRTLDASRKRPVFIIKDIFVKEK
jgi:glycosyltransferase involved in cell wall biosynthesis